MIRPLVIATLLTAPLFAGDEPAAKDHLRFTNGDQLEGHFGGFSSSGKITWERPDIAAPIELQREKVRQIVLRNARAISPITDPCHVTLVNGDRIPGKIVAADEHEVTLESSSAGVLTLPRDTLATIAPNPFGGRLLYAGPFDDKGWKIVPADKPPAGVDAFAGDNPAPAVAPKKTGDENKPAWTHSGAAWYSRAGGDALTYDAGMPDRALLRFKLGWRSRPSIAVALHADLQPAGPKDKKKAEGADEDRPPIGVMPNFARLFGTSYVLNINSGYIHLQRTGFDADGNPEVERVRVPTTTVRMPDTGEALFEIRCDRKEGSISVYINGEFAVQWYTAEEGEAPDPKAGPSYKAPGGGIGFIVQGGSAQLRSSDTQVRVSDIVVAEWNGLTDSARSMESEQQDIVLLTNGTDRFSGRIHAIHEGNVEIAAKYATLKIPMDEVAEMHFARSGRRKIDSPAESESSNKSEITVHMQPVGRISGTPLSSTQGRIQLESKLAGKMDIDLAPAIVLEFQSAGGFLDEWEDDL
ncbi:hypothetical protein [Haloferula sp. BvORR071]|uniref:hypothetical protein n=1 Tax=Haloferula sp. BvORR071 TaxID=1396141 RepID=UPI00055157D4|nr:hypothetical protein [Haloferula sp. BvORR071]